MMLASDILEGGQARILRWAFAALFVVAAHAGATALGIMHWQEQDLDDPVGALTIEMTPDAQLARVETPNIAHGPLMDEMQATPQAVKAIEKEVDTETPPFEPSPLAPEPEVAFPKPNPVDQQEPEEKKPEQEAIEQRGAEQATEAQDARAPQRVDVEAPPGPPPLSAGDRARTAQATLAWHTQLSARVNSLKDSYPAKARERGTRGSVYVRFTMDRQGNVLSAWVDRSSGSTVLDEDAVARVRRASPLPHPPTEVLGATFDLVLPVRFDIK